MSENYKKWQFHVAVYTDMIYYECFSEDGCLVMRDYDWIHEDIRKDVVSAAVDAFINARCVSNTIGYDEINEIVRNGLDISIYDRKCQA